MAARGYRANLQKQSSHINIPLIKQQVVGQQVRSNSWLLPR